MRLLLDHCVPRPLRRHFPSHTVRTTREMGWDALKNGALLAEAAKQFDVLLTVDKNLKYEHDLTRLPVAVVVLDAPMNTPEALAPFVPHVEQALTSIVRGQLIEILADGQIVKRN